MFQLVVSAQDQGTPKHTAFTSVYVCCLYDIEVFKLMCTNTNYNNINNNSNNNNNNNNNNN